MYEIRPETVKSFITDRNVRLPRFQRKQTCDPKKNFQLCISLFKEYPIGVCILSVDESKGKTVRWLLDGRQRKNALTKMYEDPENIYNWARAFIGFKNSDQPFELEEKYWEKINEYIEADVDEEYGNTSEGEDDSLPAESEEDVVIRDSSSGLELLLDIIKIIHNKQKKNTGFTKPFDFTKYVDRLPYMENGENALSSRKLKMFIDEYRNHADAYRQDYEDEDCFYEYLDSRSIVKDEKKTKQLIHDKWDEILERMLIIDKIDSQLTSSKIGMIEVKNLSPSDSQKIFNIINSEGEKLKAVEILSAKPHWNIPIINPSQEAIDAVKELYKELETVPSDVVRWDYPATILRRLGTNCVIKQFAPTKTDFVKELTCGFKIVAGIYEGGVKKESIEKLSKSTALNWNKDFDQLIYDLKNMFKLLTSYDYFRYFQSWRATIFELTSEAVAIDFFVIAYKDWERKGKPIGSDIKARQFQKNCFILWDKLIYEYIYKQWRGAADQKTAYNISNLSNEPDVFESVSQENWQRVLKEIFEESTIDSLAISQTLMTPLLYHMYCLRYIQGPDSLNEIEVDHIIPQASFETSSIKNHEVIQHNLLNLGLLPKNENASKNKKRLIMIESEWLRDQIEKYEFIPKDCFADFSDVKNYKEMFELRKAIIEDAFTTKRNTILYN